MGICFLNWNKLLKIHHKKTVIRVSKQFNINTPVNILIKVNFWINEIEETKSWYYKISWVMLSVNWLEPEPDPLIF